LLKKKKPFVALHIVVEPVPHSSIFNCYISPMSQQRILTVANKAFKAVSKQNVVSSVSVLRTVASTKRSYSAINKSNIYNKSKVCKLFATVRCVRKTDLIIVNIFYLYLNLLTFPNYTKLLIILLDKYNQHFWLGIQIHHTIFRIKSVHCR
jgi:hypothetical protein